MLRRLFAYILFVLGFLATTFFRRYSGEIIPHPSLFYLLGLAMFAGGILLLRTTPTREASELQKQIAESIKELKANGDKIHVDLTQCIMKGHNYTEEQEKSVSGEELLAFDVERQIQSWYSDPIRNMKKVQVNQSAIVYNYRNQRTGETEKFVSRVIPKDKISLSFYLDKQKQTILYVDKANRSRYYFDLDFLNSGNS